MGTGSMLVSFSSPETNRPPLQYSSIASPQGFRLLDLPAELRNRIYGFHLTTPSSHDLARFALPPITRASKQLRHETLPLFFSESAFHIIVLSNFEDRNNDRMVSRARFEIPQRNSIIRKSGVLGFKAAVKQIVRAAGAAALIRDVRFKIASSSIPCWVIPTTNDFDRYVVAELKARVAQGRVEIVVEPGQSYPTHTPWLLYDRIDVDEAVEFARETTVKVCNRIGFAGFTLKDLEDIGRSLRYVR